MAKDLEGKVFLVTGGTEGIGKAASLEFASRGATIALVGRNKEKTERVAGELRAAGATKVEPIFADLSRVSDMKRAASEFKAAHDRLDVLVNNAGGVFFKHETTGDGYEMTFALNHLSYFVITAEVLDLLKKTKGSRIVSTSSGAHQGGKIELGDIAKRPSGKAGFPVYCDSKLANILFTRELARKLDGSGVLVNCFHPGFVQTGFAMNNQGFLKSAISFGASLFARTPAKGAETLVWLAASPDATGTSGEYFFDKKVKKTTRLAYDMDVAAKLWAFTEETVRAQPS